MYLNTVQIAESLGVSEKVVEDWIRNEGLPHVMDRGRVLFDRTQVATWAAAKGLGAKVGFLAPQNPVLVTEWRLEPLLKTGGIWRGVRRNDVLPLLGKIIRQLPGTTAPVRELLAKKALSKDGITWAPVGHGFAMPHMSNRATLGRDSGSLSLLFLDEDLPDAQPSPDGAPVRILLFFIAPSPRAHLDLLSRLGRALSKGQFRDLALRGASDEELLTALAHSEASEGEKGTRSPGI